MVKAPSGSNPTVLRKYSLPLPVAFAVASNGSLPSTEHKNNNLKNQ